MKIRTALPTDAATLGKVHVAAWRETYAQLFPAIYLARLSEIDRARQWAVILADPKNASQTVIAEEGGETFGFCTVGPARRLRSEHIGEVRALYLLRSAQGRGFGRMLLSSGASMLDERGFHSAIVWVAKQNVCAIHFYEHFGASAVGERSSSLDGFTFFETKLQWTSVASLVSSTAQ